MTAILICVFVMLVLLVRVEMYASKYKDQTKTNLWLAEQLGDLRQRFDGTERQLSYAEVELNSHVKDLENEISELRRRRLNDVVVANAGLASWRAESPQVPARPHLREGVVGADGRPTRVEMSPRLRNQIWPELSDEMQQRFYEMVLAPARLKWAEALEAEESRKFRVDVGTNVPDDNGDR